MTSLTSKNSVEFRFYRPQAKIAHVAGDFNHWSKKASPMHLAGDGWWTAKLHLPAGEYRFRYVVDGQWFTDFAAHGVERADLGWNSVLVVPARKHSRRSREIKAKISPAATRKIRSEPMLAHAAR